MTEPAEDRSEIRRETAASIEAQLLGLYGPMMGPSELREALSYRSADALRQAIARKRVDLPLFEIEGRRGKFALTSDVAAWLYVRRSGSVLARRGPKPDGYSG